MASILPSKLYSKASNSLVDTADALKGSKYVGLYFSAHWCPPCRKFTPILSGTLHFRFYLPCYSLTDRAEWVAKNAASKQFKVIFASNDKSESEMNSYFKSMSWDLACT